MDHCVQILSLFCSPPNNLTQCLKVLSKHLNLSNPHGIYPSQNEGPTAPHPRYTSPVLTGQNLPSVSNAGLQQLPLLAMGMDIL